MFPRLNQKLKQQARLWVFMESLGLLAAIGSADWILPYEMSLLMFYFVPVSFASWYGSRAMGFLLAVFGTVAWWLANLPSHPFSPEAHLWAALNRLVFFLLVAAGSHALRYQREADRKKMEAMERTRELEEEILRVVEGEQMRIGQDLHDGLCQNLAAIDCAVACLRQDLEEKGLTAEASSAEFIQTQLGRATMEARDTARGLFPVQWQEEGFLAALEDLVSTTNRLRQLRVRLQTEGEIRIKTPEAGMHLYRIVQEALSNVSQHSEATEVVIGLQRTDHHLDMTVSDDGRGLEARGTGRGIGMQTMLYRARSLGGKLEVLPRAEGGTVVRCSVPLAPS